MAPLTLFNEAPKRKSVALLTLKNAYLRLSWPPLSQERLSEARERQERLSEARECQERLSEARERQE